MLFDQKGLVEEYDANKKKVDTQCYGRVILDPVPGILHTPAPVYIIKNHDRSLM